MSVVHIHNLALLVLGMLFSIEPVKPDEVPGGLPDERLDLFL